MHRRTPASTSAMPCAAADQRSGSAAPRRSRNLPRLSVAAVLALFVLVAPTTAGAQGDVITIEFDDVVFAPAGSTVPVGSVAVAPDLQGRTCRTSVITANQSSIHADNDLLISTGGSTALIEDVEDFTDGTNSWLVDITLGSMIDMSVQMGPDGISSLGFTVEIDCSGPLVGSTVPVLASSVTTSTTTTSTTTASTTTASTTTASTASTTTTSPPSTTTTAPTTTVDLTTSDTTGSTTTTVLATSSSQLQVQETTTASNTTTWTTASTTTMPTTTTTQAAETTSTTADQGQLEQSPAASAVPAQPSYTG